MNRSIHKNGKLLSEIAAVLLFAAFVLGCKHNISTPETFSVTFGVAGQNGSLKAKADGITETDKSPIPVEKGKTVTFTSYPANGYEVDKWTVNGTVMAKSAATYSHEVTAKTDVRVVFKASVVAVTDVTLDKSELKLEEGKTEKLTATVLPENATNKKVTWSSGNTEVADVSSDGTVTAKTVGMAKITVKTEDGNKTAECTVRVTVPQYQISFAIAGGNGTLKAMVGSSEIHSGDKVEKDKTITFTATPATNYKVKEWKVNGVGVTGYTSNIYTHTVTKAVTVKVSTQLMSASEASYTVKHYQEKAEGGYPAEPTETETLNGTVGTDAAYTSKTYEGFAHKSNLTEINGSVQQNGTIKPDGSTVVKLYYERKTVNVTFELAGGNVAGNTEPIVTTGKYGTPLTAPVPVKTDFVFKGWYPDLPSPLLYPAADAEYTAQWVPLYEITFSVNGAGGTLKATVGGTEINSGHKVEQSKTVTFTSYPANGYEVDKWTVNGTVMAKSAATYSHEVTAKTDVRVVFKASIVAVTGVMLNQNALTLVEGKNGQLTATVSPANTTNKKVTWSSGNTEVADVDQDGTVTAKKAGEAKITVKTEDGNKTADCTVT